MATIEPVRYTAAMKADWDAWVRRSKNGIFLFLRDYMDYHRDRFTDHSLLFFQEDKLLGILPASQHDDSLVSHGGLTFGGILSDNTMRTATMMAVFETMRDYCRRSGIQSIRYKAVPSIFHTIPAEEDLYALFRYGAQLVRRDVSSTIRLDSRLKYSKGRKCSLKIGQKAGIHVEPSQDYEGFMQIEQSILEAKYNTVPTHTAAELHLLAEALPEHIKLFTARLNNETVAGVVVYESQWVAHTQYIGASPLGKETGAVDCIIDHLLTRVYPDKRYFSFGISTEEQGRYLNEGLILQKEMYGARATVFDTYELPCR